MKQSPDEEQQPIPNEEKRTQYLFKPPVVLLERLKQLAWKHHRSTNSELVIAMEEYLARHEQHTDKERPLTNGSDPVIM